MKNYSNYNIDQSLSNVRGHVKDFYAKHNKLPKYMIITHGCQMNVHDSDKIKYMLEKLGYTSATDIKEADFILFNTCLVRENAELKVYGQIGALKHLKEQKEDLIIAICGCMMQTGEARKVILDKFKQVDIIFGTKNISLLPELIDYHLMTGETAVDISKADMIDNQLPIKRTQNHTAYINIMTGCNNFCSYCIVPYARGREESRNPESILQEIREVKNQGYKEIVLLGQNVNSYGKDQSDYPEFHELLSQIHEINGIERIRFLTSHPKDISHELINQIAKLDKVCNNLHLPFQSGSNRILKLMNRKYTREKYLDIINKLRDKIPKITFSTDIIVGFPTETEEDFLDTLDIVRQVEFEQAFTFLYSKRPGTKAATMSDQIPKEIKQDRFERLVDEVYEIFYRKNQLYLGRTEDVLVEGISKTNNAMLTGRSEGYKIVNFPGNRDEIGTIIPVKITDFNSFALTGEKI